MLQNFYCALAIRDSDKIFTDISAKAHHLNLKKIAKKQLGNNKMACSRRIRFFLHSSANKIIKSKSGRSMSLIMTCVTAAMQLCARMFYITGAKGPPTHDFAAGRPFFSLIGVAATLDLS